MADPRTDCYNFVNTVLSTALRALRGQVAQMVERSPEKAGVGGSIPSLATMFSVTYKAQKPRFGSNWFQFHGVRIPP